MKIKRMLMLFSLGLLTLTGCSTNSNQSDVGTTSNDKISLNVHQADLIADITDNEKYLNKDLLYSVDTLDDSDSINIIITMDTTGLADKYSKSKGYKTLGDYVNSNKSQSAIKQMSKDQEQLAEYLIDKDYINEVHHSYTTLFNGFSAQTTYGQYKKLKSANMGINVTVSEVYAEAEHQSTQSSDYEAVTNFVNVYGTGIFDSSGVGYDGSNTAVAILDSGFDIHHTVFQNEPNTPMISRDDVNEVLLDSKAYGYFNDIKVQDVYINSKIPFAYDYADKDPDVAPFDSNHGTHVAGIIGGKDEVITGVAINTQLVLMKVFGDINNGAIQDDILAALEDAMLLGVDAINLSLGSACGFARSSDNEDINKVYDKIEAAGISLVVAASNDYSSGYGGEQGNTNKASNPDSATVGSPGTYTSTISVASISGVKSKYMVDKEGHTFFFNNANNNAGKAYDFYEMIFDLLGSEEKRVEVEYVTVPGVGKKVNYSNIDVEGKIALVKRGDISFEEKAQIALSQGAIGCIIYNNVAGEVFMNAGSNLEIAFCSISKDDGEYLANKNTGTLVLDASYLAGPFMSDFSSWGPVSDLSLKPEITAHGGTILSSVPGGGYEEISGTSMACPNLCGVIILVRQALKERYPEMTTVELNNMTNQLLMSTGTIILDENGNPYSPRKQGAGLGNLDAALETLAYLSVEGSTKTKIELKDDPNKTGKYVLEFDINNISDKTLTYNLSNLTMTESLSTSDPEFVAEKAYMLNPKTSAQVSGSGSINNNVITVEANGKVHVTYTLELTSAEKRYMIKSFPNGMYVEGFAVLTSQNQDGIDLSIPFLAFFGDWTVAPMFDKTFYEVESEAHNGAIDEEDKIKADYYATTPLGTYYYSYIIPLGSYVYEIDESKYEAIPASEEHAAIGYNLETINGITTVYAGLLRNAKRMTTTIRNADTGEIVYEHLKYDEHKAYFSGSIIPGYDLINITAAELGLQNNTKYTFTMVAELDYGDGGASSNLNNSFEFSFYVDYQAPIITDAQFYTKYDKSLKDYRYYVDVYVYDNHYAQSIRPFTIVDGKLTSLSENVIPIYGERGSISKVSVEITDYMDLLQYGVLEDGTFSISNGLGFLVDDYALNQSYSYVTLPGTNSDNISYKDLTLSNGNYLLPKKLNPGDVMDLASMLTSDDMMDEDPEVQTNYFAKLKWESSNEDVVKVKDGVIEAQYGLTKESSAYVTCTTMNTDGYVYTATLKVTVKADKNSEIDTQKVTDIKFTYFDTLKAFIDGGDMSEIGEAGDRTFFTEKSMISFYPSEQVQIGYELEPWNLKDYELIWSSTNEKVATVDEKGVVTAVKEGSATITLKVKVDGKTSTLMGSVRVSVKSEFVIEGTTLVAYKGQGGNVVIPDDEGILYIGAFAFSLYTIDYEIEITEDDYDAAKTPGGNDSVTSVVIPSDVLEVQKYAFYNCTSLESVTFLSNEKGDTCPLIREYAFAGNKKLKNINLENIEIIGERAFDGCVSLTDIDLTSTYAIARQAFRGCTGLTHVDITALRNAGTEVFLNCTSLESVENGRYTNFSEGMFKNSGLVTIDYKADRIPNSCFANCSKLTDVNIINSVVYVGANAFDNCKSLTNVVFTDNAGTEFIYEYAFNNCTNLRSVKLPNSEFVIESFAFNKCSNLENIIFNTKTYITNNLGSIFNSCNKLSTFEVVESNPYYTSSDNLLLSNETIILAAPNFDYGDYVIPQGITKISNSAFSSISNLTSVVIPTEVTEIKANAFENCKNLSSVILPTTDLQIGSNAFAGCTNLTSVTNIESLSKFSSYVFANTKLSTVTIGDEAIIETGAFSSIPTLISVITGDNVKIGDYAFANNQALVDVQINTDTIGAYAFNNCTSLQSLDLSMVEVIKEGAFAGCKALNNLNLLNATIIEAYAFADNSNLSNVEFTSVETIGEYAFTNTTKDGSNKLVNLSLPNTLKTIGSYAFANSNLLKTVSIGNGVETIGEYAFSGCLLLETITVSNTLKTISKGLFCEDESLASVNIEGVEVVEAEAFVNCYNLKNINLINVVSVGMQAFYNCTSLETANLVNVVTLEAGAFLGAEKLTTVNIPKVEYIGAQALSCIGVTEITIPSTVEKIEPTAFYYNVNQVTFKTESGNTTGEINSYALLDEGVLYTKTANDKLLLSAYPTNKSASEYNVLFNTVRVEEYAGYFNKNIEKITFPDTMKMIGNMCFYGCTKLSTVEFKSTVAPTLEGTVSALDLEYSADSEIYQLLNKYFQFNGYYPLYYGQFKDMIGKAKKLNMIIPANKDVEGYDNILYKLYFNYDNLVKSEYEALNKNSIDYLNKVVLVPSASEVTLNDGDTIVAARTAYNLLNQDLTDYNYSEEYLSALLENLEAAEIKWKELKLARIQEVYQYLIEEIEQLGPNYDYNKISDYYSILESIDLLSRDDEKFMSDNIDCYKNVESFKEGFDKYFKELNEDINTIGQISTLPTSKINKVGLTALIVVSITSLVAVAGLFIKRWLI